MNRAHRLDQLLGAARIADAPAGHAIGLRDAVDGQRAVIEPRLDLRDRAIFEIVVDQVLVHVVGHNPDMLVLEQHVGDLAEVALGIGGARRVRRRVQDQPFRARRDRRVEILGPHLEAVILGAGDRHRIAVAQQHHLRVRHPIGGRNHNLVAGAQSRAERVVEHLLAAAADRDLGGLVIEPVLALELAADRALQLDAAVEDGIAGLAVLDRADAGLADIGRRVEIGLALRERDDVAPGRLQFGGEGGDRHCRRGLYASETVGEKGHGGGILTGMA